MIPSPAAPWQSLFPAPTSGAGTLELRFRLVSRRGEPLLLIPNRRPTIREALALYPAQTARARAARALLTTGLRMGLGLGTRAITLHVDPQAAFLRFLLPANSTPRDASFALLCGNPRAPGRRFILLTFDQAGRPVKLVKAGLGEQAAALIRSEAAFLTSFPTELLHAPVVTGTLSAEGIEALALQFAAGRSPDPQCLGPLADLLQSWLRRDRQVGLKDLPVWQRLGAGSKTGNVFRRLESVLEVARFHPAIHHGDFAPWNIRVDPVTQHWTVLDWERGEPLGPPAWDWIHFVIQTLILVHRAEPEVIANRVEAMLDGGEFSRYAAQAGIGDIVRPLVLAYLLHHVEVIKPAEGGDALRELLEVLMQRWLSA